MYKIDYEVQGRAKYVIGKLVNETDEFYFLIGTRNNKEYMVRKKNIISKIEIEEGR
jgi:hypothetical protein